MILHCLDYGRNPGLCKEKQRRKECKYQEGSLTRGLPASRPLVMLELLCKYFMQ